MTTLAAIALLVACAARMLTAWREQPMIVRSTTFALAIGAVLLLARQHGTAPGVCVALAAVMAAVACLVIARPLFPRVASWMPTAAAVVALAALLLEVIDVA
jgi:hypothetical protein